MSTSNERSVAVGGVLIASVLGLLIFFLRFCGSASLPAPPLPPALASAMSVDQVTARLDASKDGYVQHLRKDSHAYRIVPATTYEQMSRSFAYEVSNARVELRVGGDPATVAGLQLSAVVRDGMLALRINNMRSHPMAYRVTTRPQRGRRACRNRDRWVHNAMALREHGHAMATVVRSECKHKRGSGLVVSHVETLALPLLGFFYVSRLSPSSVAMEGDILRRHRPPEGAPCRRAVSAALERGLREGEITWRDLVDFYGRHTCAAYRFPLDYRALKSGDGVTLPAGEQE